LAWGCGHWDLYNVMKEEAGSMKAGGNTKAPTSEDYTGYLKPLMRSLQPTKLKLLCGYLQSKWNHKGGLYGWVQKLEIGD